MTNFKTMAIIVYRLIASTKIKSHLTHQSQLLSAIGYCDIRITD